MQPLKQPLSEALLSQVESTTIAQSITKDISYPTLHEADPNQNAKLRLEVVKRVSWPIRKVTAFGFG